LRITTYSSLPSIVRVYDVQDLIQHGIEFNHSSFTPGIHPTRSWGPATEKGMMESMMYLIQGAVHLDCWDAYGGTAMIEAVGKRLIISGPKPLHDDVQEFLRRLRDASPP